MPRSRGGSRASSRAGSRASYSDSVSRTRSLGVGTRGDDPKYSSRSRSAGPKIQEAPTAPRVQVRTPARSVAEESDQFHIVGKASKHHRRNKRGGFNHPAAVQSAPDLFNYYPPEATRKDKNKEDPSRNFNPAGLNSTRMQELLSNNLREGGESKAKAVYQPSSKSDPITHTVFEKELSREVEAVKGSAGLDTYRLTKSLMTGVKEINKRKQEKRAKEKKTDPITHVGGPPDVFVGGLRRFSGQGTYNSRIPLYHDAGVPEKMRPEDILKLKKTRIVRTGKGVIYIHAGLEDMLPPAVNNYSKADLPPSAAHKAENDRRLLPGFYRNKNVKPSDTLEESEDMYYSMYGQNWVDSGMNDSEEFWFPNDTKGRSGSYTQRARDDSRIPSDYDGRARAMSARLQRSKSAVDFRRSSAAGSVAESDLPSYTSVNSQTRGIWSTPNQVTLSSNYASNYDGLLGETITI